MDKYQITSQLMLRRTFWKHHPEFIEHYRTRKTQNDYNATIRSTWCDWLDHMRRDGVISEALANRATL